MWYVSPGYTAIFCIYWASLVAQMVENPPAMWETAFNPWVGKIPLRREEGNGYPLQCCCLENSMDRGAWQAAFLGVAKSRTQLSNWLSLSFSYIVSETSCSSSFQRYSTILVLKIYLVNSLILSGWNRSPAQVGCMRQVLGPGALGRPRGIR